MVHGDYKKDMEIVEIAKFDATVQTEDIAEFYIKKCKVLEKHNEILKNNKICPRCGQKFTMS